MNKYNYTVYIHITPSNKFYVGLTSMNVKKRWINGNGYKQNIYFTNAIKKYGWENIKHEIIASNLNKKEAENFEILIINNLKSNEKKYGYNIKFGGSSTKHSEETKLKMSENHANFFGENNPNARAVICINNGDIISNIKEASIKYKTFQNTIFKCCNGELMSAGKDMNNKKLRWIYFDKINEKVEYIKLFNYQLYLQLIKDEVIKK